MGNMQGWHYYKHALLPDMSPDSEVDTSFIESGKAWSCVEGKVILARWTSEFDCGYETDWWYVIKDEQFDISTVNSNTRYKINKGKRLFEVRKISPESYKEELYRIQTIAYNEYPEKYRPTVVRENFFKTVDTSWSNEETEVYGAFYKETGIMAGYVLFTRSNNCFHLVSQKVCPEYEKYQINAALVGAALDDKSELLAKGFYICDGERNIQHETAFQDYLERYFGFRKAYCKLNIVYNPKYKAIVELIYPFRKLLRRFDGIGIIHKINGVLTMEEIVRKQKKADKKDAK